ncbi:Listeria/Bacterioides repeat-containing protein [Ruminococcus sp. YRD2003]|uniref:InlB B-repeat-containing protein n=1 Tax=Ruminococcus sp. YRD2003 TaxID=1452313 RepID=UPI0008B823BB|nr:Listeria/Bacterioides repeat-containing protein [Ruminococcus flavefaciens]
MKKSHRRPIAVILAAAVSLSTFGGLFTASAADDEGKKEIKLIYEIDEDATAGKTTDLSLFEPSTTDEAHTNVPAGNFTKKGYIFSGWTYDGVVGYSSGQFVDLPADADEVVFHMCWIDPTQEKHTVKYVLERDGMTFENPEWLEDESYSPNEVFTPNDTTVFVEKETENGTLKYVSKWLTDGERVYSYATQLVMPDHDIVLYPILYRKIQLTYFAGDVDRLNGNSEFSFEKTEGTSDELAGKDRFSRRGFTLTGWESSADGKIYKPTETVVMPGEDVTFTAVWQPVEYKVVFNPGNGGTVIKIPAETDTVITCPAPEITVDGKHFAGWKSNDDGKIYQIGDEYKVLGAVPGMGISFKAVWEDGDAPEVTTTTFSSTTSATTTSATTSSASTSVTTSTATATTVATFIPEDIISGDANCDKKVSVADSVAILQHIGNHDKYGLSELGMVNGDVDGEAGITANDALTIQKYDAKVITEFPAK